MYWIIKGIRGISVFIMLYIKSYIFVDLLIPSSTNGVSRAQTPRSRHFLRFYNFVAIILWLEKIRPYFWKLELWFWTYGWIRLLGPSGPNVVVGPTPRGQEIFWDFMILLYSSYDSGEKEVLSVKIRASVVDF